MRKRRHVKKPEVIPWGFRPTGAPFRIHYVSDASVSEILGKLVRNPNYDGPQTGHPHGYPGQRIPEVGFKPSFFAALEKDVKENGFRNPVILQQCSEGLWLQFGASRYRVARKLAIPALPAVIVDWVGRFVKRPEVTPENWRTFFTDIPKYFEFTPEGIDHHYSLERKARDHYDPAGFEWCGESADFIDQDFGWLRGRS